MHPFTGSFYGHTLSTHRLTLFGSQVTHYFRQVTTAFHHVTLNFHRVTLAFRQLTLPSCQLTSLGSGVTQGFLQLTALNHQVTLNIWQVTLDSCRMTRFNNQLTQDNCEEAHSLRRVFWFKTRLTAADKRPPRSHSPPPGHFVRVQCLNVERFFQNRSREMESRATWHCEKNFHGKEVKKKMNKRQENKLTMYKGVSDLLGNNGTITATIPAFAATIAEFDETVDAISAKASEAQTVTKGKTAVKNQAALDLIDMCVRISAGLGIHAVQTNDLELEAKVDFTETGLGSLRDTMLAMTAETLLALAKEHATPIEQFGISADNVTLLGTQITAYNKSIGRKESSFSERSGAHKSLKSLYAAADSLLEKQMDKFVTILQNDHPEFASEYRSARVVKNAGIHHETPAEQPQANETVPAETPAQ